MLSPLSLLVELYQPSCTLSSQIRKLFGSFFGSLIFLSELDHVPEFLLIRSWLRLRIIILSSGIGKGSRVLREPFRKITPPNPRSICSTLGTCHGNDYPDSCILRKWFRFRSQSWWLSFCPLRCCVVELYHTFLHFVKRQVWLLYSPLTLTNSVPHI